MKHTPHILLLLAAMVCATSCEKAPCDSFKRISGKGEVREKTFHLEPFSRIVLEGVANLNIRVGEAQSLSLKAQENLIDLVHCQVLAGTLTISLKEGVSLMNHEEISLDISVLSLHGLLHAGIGQVILDGESQEAFEIDHRGTGDVDAYHLPVDHGMVLHGGIGSCMVHVHEHLEVDISATGDVFYSGNPQITLNDSGLGDLIKTNN